MKLDFKFIAEDPAYQSQAVELLGRCFPEYWEQIARASGKFPFTELSFIAVNEANDVVGHVGVMPFTTAGFDGQDIKMAGIASVAVDPGCRGQKIAQRLCQMAAEWADSENFDMLPLFTSLHPVYRSSGWEDYPAQKSVTLKRNTTVSGTVAMTPGRELSAADRDKIIDIYQNSDDFPGKVRRTLNNDFHGWKRIFNEPGSLFAISGNAYIALLDGILAEVSGPADEAADLLDKLALPDNIAAALPANAPVFEHIKYYEVIADSPDVWHKESVMIHPLQKVVRPGIMFPLLDKF